MPLEPVLLPSVFDNTGPPQTLWQGLSDKDAPIGKRLRCATSQGDLQTNSVLAVTLTPSNGFPSAAIRDTIIGDFEERFGDDGTIRGLYEAHSLFLAAKTNAPAPPLTTTTTNTVQQLAVYQHQNAPAPAPVPTPPFKNQQWGLGQQHGEHGASVDTRRIRTTMERGPSTTLPIKPKQYHGQPRRPIAICRSLQRNTIRTVPTTGVRTDTSMAIKHTSIASVATTTAARRLPTTTRVDQQQTRHNGDPN